MRNKTFSGAALLLVLPSRFFALPMQFRVQLLAIFCFVSCTCVGQVLPIRERKQPVVVRYSLTLAENRIEIAGKSMRAFTVNGGVPGLTLEFFEGDTAEIWVNNQLSVSSSLHWHGLLLPNSQDGVPWLTQAPIGPGETRLYRFPLVQHGTYWYHSHSNLQEQAGVYGAFIVRARDEDTLAQASLLFSDWSHLKPGEIDRRLHAATDWFAIQKKATQSYSEALLAGRLRTKLKNEAKRMLAMDVSDVAYDAVLTNGDTLARLPTLRPGKVRLRLINGSSSTYFWVKYSNGPLTVVAADGKDVQPVQVDRLILAVAETYDVIVTVPQGQSSVLMATSEDRTRHTTTQLGNGPPQLLLPFARLHYFEGMEMMNNMMSMGGNMTGMPGMKMTNQLMDMNTVMYPEVVDSESTPQTLTYVMLKAANATTLPPGPTRNFNFTLTGNMNRYVWTMDNRTVSESKNLYIHKGERIRVVLFNNSMMRHPMHLHGHYFRVLNGQGAFSPLKNVLDIMPMETDTLEFAATETGSWIFHCHILYHMMSGMGRVFTYAGSSPLPDLTDTNKARRRLFATDRMPHAMAMVGLASNGSDGEAMLMNTRWQFETMWHLGMHPGHGYESETMLGRYFGRMQWWQAYLGFDYHYKRLDHLDRPDNAGLTGNNFFGDERRTLFGTKSNKPNRQTAVVGIRYLLPGLFWADARLDGQGKARLQLSREDVPLTPRLRMSLMFNTDKEYMLCFRYIATRWWSVGTHYDSDMGFGMGLWWSY